METVEETTENINQQINNDNLPIEMNEDLQRELGNSLTVESEGNKNEVSHILSEEPDKKDQNQVFENIQFQSEENIEKEDKSSQNQVILEGIALKALTNMYTLPSRDSEVLRTFEQGKVLKFYNHSSSWYTSYVKVDGVDHKIYINKDDVEEVISSPVLLEGIALRKSTNKLTCILNLQGIQSHLELFIKEKF